VLVILEDTAVHLPKIYNKTIFIMVLILISGTPTFMEKGWGWVSIGLPLSVSSSIGFITFCWQSVVFFWWYMSMSIYLQFTKLNSSIGVLASFLPT